MKHQLREYPKIPHNLANPIRPVSFICVKFSDEFEHNISQSECVHDALNEFIVIDNTANLFYPTLGQAICAGISQAQYELLVVVHEDVLLLPGWQSMFEQSLGALEAADPEWLLAGIVGWDSNDEMQGHSSDPHSYRNLLLDRPFAEITRIDEQVLILRKSKELFPDPELPGIHHIGRDLPLEAARRGYKSYVINAPSIHKYADERGELIQTASDSSKITQRQRLDYLADRACADEYLENKWPEIDKSSLTHNQPGPWTNARPPKLFNNVASFDKGHRAILDSPIILLSKGGGGSRLLSLLAGDVDLFIGNDVNPTGDSREMARSIYRAIIRKFRCSNEAQRNNIVPDLRATASQMLEHANWPDKWAFKLPESVFILPELMEAFPNAGYVFFYRDPLSTVLRRKHMTASLDNQIGQITLALAYSFFQLNISELLTDSDIHHNIRSTTHQLELVANFHHKIPDEKWLSLSFEDLMMKPESLLSDMSQFVEQDVVSNVVLSTFDQRRALRPIKDYPDDVIDLATTLLEPIRQKFGYV